MAKCKIFRTWFIGWGCGVHYIDHRYQIKIKNGKKVSCTCCRLDTNVVRILEQEILKEFEFTSIDEI